MRVKRPKSTSWRIAMVSRRLRYSGDIIEGHSRADADWRFVKSIRHSDCHIKKVGSAAIDASLRLLIDGDQLPVQLK